MSADGKAVCVPCRKVFKGEGRISTTDNDTKPVGRFPLRFAGNGAGMHILPKRCPICNGEVINVSYKWRAPRRRDGRAWKRIASGDLLWENDPKLAKSPLFNPNWKKGQGRVASGFSRLRLSDRQR